MAFEGVDFLGLSEELTEEERLVRDSVRQFVDSSVLPIIGEAYEKSVFPRNLVPRMGKLGLLGANLEGYGCAGIGDVAYGLIMQELERGDSGIRSFCSVQGALVMYPIHTFGSEEHRRQWLPRLASGDAIGCFGLTEPDFGSNPAGMRTRAERKDDRWVLNGSKMWITNGSIADVAIIWARTDAGIRGFVVPTDTPGFSARLIENKISLRASVTSQLFLEDLELPLDAMLPGAEGLKGPLSCLTQARYGIAWGACGAAMAIYDEARRYSLERIQFDKPIASFQLVQQKLVTMLVEITKAQLLALRLGRLKERKAVSAAQVSMGKMNNVAVARECARLGREILGANGIMLDYQVARHMGNIESVYTYEGTHDIHTLILGHAITGIPAFS
jgi:glutaryl-CoA dehydrogenase